MNDQDIYIEQLMMEKLAGVVDPDELAYLDELIENDETVGMQWAELKGNFDRMDSQQYMERLDAGMALSRLQSRMGTSRGEKGPSRIEKGISRIEKGTSRIEKGTSKMEVGRKRFIRVAVAASLLVPLIFAGIIYIHRKDTVPPALAEVKKPDRSVKLYLGGHKVLTLDQHTETADTSDVKNVKLTIGNGSLSYVPLNEKADYILNTLVVPATMTYNLTLADGVEVWLNSESQLKFPFSFTGDKREVWVSGEVYFKVTKDIHRPFIVHTPLYDIQVLGTEFNVNTYDSLHAATALVTGAINARTANGTPILVKPGYKAVLTRGNVFELSAFDSESQLSWMKGLYYFQNALLEDITPAIRRWYGITLVLDDPAISGLRFTGAMRKNRPLNEFLDNLTLTSGVSYTNKNGVIHLKAR